MILMTKRTGSSGVLRKTSGTKFDIWALGCVFLENDSKQDFLRQLGIR